VSHQPGLYEGRHHLLMSDEARKRHFAEAREEDSALGTKGAEGAGIGAAVGGGLGAVLAGLAAAGIIALPGIGLIAMGPIAAALAGGAIGATGGGIVGALIGSGIPEDHARRYESGIREGKMVMALRRGRRRTPRTSSESGLTIRLKTSIGRGAALRSRWALTRPHHRRARKGAGR
jgi:hypothetical protein